MCWLREPQYLIGSGLPVTEGRERVPLNELEPSRACSAEEMGAAASPRRRNVPWSDHRDTTWTMFFHMISGNFRLKRLFRELGKFSLV